jgi:hypothetical protein
MERWAMSFGIVYDIDFLQHEVTRRDHFLYVYKRDSALLRPKVRARIEAFAQAEGWAAVRLTPNASLEGQLIAPSLISDATFIACDGAQFELKDLKSTLEGIACASFKNHLLMMVREGSRLLEEAAWHRAKDAVGLIVEPTITIDNYRSVTRGFLKHSDLSDVQQFGTDDRFLSRIRTFVQGRNRSPFDIAMEIDRIVLTQMKDGAFLDGDPEFITDRGEQRISERLNDFLDNRTTATLHPLLILMDATLATGNDPEWVLARLLRATANIVAGRDQRYKRNREGNPAVRPYLVWGVLLLTRGCLLDGNFVGAFEHLCQEYHSAARDPDRWFADAMDWQAIAVHLQATAVDEPTNLDKARNELRSAVGKRIKELSDVVGLDLLLPLVVNTEGEPDAVLENA